MGFARKRQNIFARRRMFMPCTRIRTKTPCAGLWLPYPPWSGTPCQQPRHRTW